MKYFFTSVNNCYIPKATILAKSLKKIYSDAYVICMLSDLIDDGIDYSVFDKVLTIEDIDVPVDNLESWIFSHTVVELCTAVKPFAFKKIIKLYECDTLVYLDPDTVVYSAMDEMYNALDNFPIVLTPHVSIPAKETEDILDGELLGCLRHGVFNLGFLAIRYEGEGRDFINWWADRCLQYCYDDGARGLFTDQRWIDLAPCFFEKICILRHPSYNAATWNLYYRDISRDGSGALMVNEIYPLRFFHFSGFDIGTHEIMLKKHAPGNAVLKELSEDYVKQQELYGQLRIGRKKGFYDFYGNGAVIEKESRILYREFSDLKSKYPKPYTDVGYFEWINSKNNSEENNTVKNNVFSTVLQKISKNYNAVSVAKKLLPNSVYNYLKRSKGNG